MGKAPIQIGIKTDHSNYQSGDTVKASVYLSMVSQNTTSQKSKAFVSTSRSKAKNVLPPVSKILVSVEMSDVIHMQPLRFNLEWLILVIVVLGSSQQ